MEKGYGVKVTGESTRAPRGPRRTEKSSAIFSGIILDILTKLYHVFNLV